MYALFVDFCVMAQTSFSSFCYMLSMVKFMTLNKFSSFCGREVVIMVK